MSIDELARLWMQRADYIESLREAIAAQEALQQSLGDQLGHALADRLPAIPPGLKGYKRAQTKRVEFTLDNGAKAFAWFHIHAEEDRWFADGVYLAEEPSA